MLVGVTLSANLDSSSSLAKAKRLVVVVDGCCSLAQEGGCSSSGCGHDATVATSAFPTDNSFVNIDWPLLSMVESMLAMATLFLLRTVVARSELLLLCMYGVRVRDF